ncbi:MAG: PAS domain S-box protein [Polyangiaceae bacterium]|jgi:PAS domain S-box-containing protein|nr:PAS domain S-box protein [Polyangiaceae bacterium]
MKDLRVKTQAIEEATAPILMTNPEGQITYANRAFQELLGLRFPDDLLGKTPLDFAANPALAQHGLDAARRSGAWKGSGGLRRSDGTVVPVEVSGTVVRDESDQPQSMMAWFTDLTERRRAERDLRLKDMAIASSLAAIALVGLDGKITYANDAFADMLRAESPEACVGMSTSDFAEPPDVAAEIACRVREAGRFSGDVLARRRDGSIFPVHLSLSMVRDDEGEPVCMLAWHADLTEQRRYEQQLRASRDEYRSLADNIPGMIYRAGADWSATIVSGCQELCGYSEEALMTGAMRWDTLVHPDDVARVMAEVGALSVRPSQIAQEYRIVHKEGSIRWVRDCKSSRFDSSGQFQGVDGIVLDVTDRKRAEEQLQTFRELMDQTNDAIFVFEPTTGRFVDVNRRACESLQRSREELLQTMTAKDIEAVALDDRAWAATVASLRGGPSITEGTHRRKDGTTFPVEINAALLKAGAQNYVVAVSRDITERKKAEQALRASQREIEDKVRLLQETTAELIQSEKLSALGELAAGIAHEMTQPLNSIKLICEDLLGDIRKDSLQTEDVKPNLEDVAALVDKLTAIVDQMRLFVRRPDITVVESCDVNEATAGVFKMIGQQLRDQGFEIHMQLGDSLACVPMDLVKLEQVLMNLVTNARDAVVSFRGDDRKLEVRTRQEASASGSVLVVLEVEDNGKGVPPHVKAKLFEPFFTTKRAGAGTGLGLSIARRIVTECGGELDVESVEGQGALFRVRIPADGAPPSGNP